MKNRALAIMFFLWVPLLLSAQTGAVSSVDSLLQLSLEQLMNIKVVTASGYAQTTAEAPSTITVITAQQIKDRGYEQLEDALRDVPGIDMIHLNGYAPTLIYFRGMYGAENLRALLMIDGIVENNIIGTNDMAGPAYSLHNVKRIEIISGPASALYGANAFGGVINIITKNGSDINGFTAEQGFGSFNTTFEKVSMGLKKNKFEFDIAGTLYSTDGPKFANRDPDYSASYVDKAYSLNTRVSYVAKNSKTTLGFHTYKTPIGWGTFFNSATTFLGLPSQGYQNSGLLGLISSNIRGGKPGLLTPYLTTYFLQNTFKPNEKLRVLTRLVYRETGIGDDSYAYVTLDGHTLIRSVFTNYSNEFSGEVSADYSFAPRQRLTGGIEFERENVERANRTMTFDPHDIYLLDGKDTLINLHATFLPRKYDIRKNFGSYLQYALNTDFLNKTNFTAGIRYDYNSYYGDRFSPRIAIVNQPTDQLTFKLLYGTAFRAPTNLEIYQSPPDFPLQTEKIKTYEADAIYSFSKKLRLQLNLFSNELTDVIVIGNLTGVNPNKNPGAQTINGIELGGDMMFGSNTTAFANFTFQDARGKNFVTHTSGFIPGVARFKGNAGVTFRIGELFTLNIIENWIGKRQVPRTDPYGPVAGYFITNCVVTTKELFNRGITASLNVRNVFNTKWLDPGFRTADGFLFSTVLEQPGINGLFKIGIKL
ncbi:MAG: TonB-dependent receptor plug domain-containing protein [Ginsengibacter sp.]